MFSRRPEYAKIYLRGIINMFDIGTIWLKSSYYLLSHRSDLRKWWVIVLVAVSVFITFFTITNIVIYLIGIPNASRYMVSMATSQVDYNGIRARSVPLSLIIEDPIVVSAGKGKYDIIAHVINNNPQWAVSEISYSFTANGQEGKVRLDYVMPNSEKFFTDLSVRLDEGTINVEVAMAVDNIKWQRVDNPSLLQEVDFLVDNVTYLPIKKNNATAYRVTADVTNNSLTSFWNTKFIVVLYNADTVLAIQYVYFEPFNAEETKSLLTQWDTVTGNVTDVGVVADINMLDQSNIIE